MVLSRALAPQMKERSWGRIIHISSIMGLISKGRTDRLLGHEVGPDRHGPGKAAGPGPLQHHRELHRTGTVL